MIRACCDDTWPRLFEITDVASMIVAYLPDLNYRQWLVECDNNTQQTQLCNWRPSSYYYDTHVQVAIAKQKNWNAFIKMVPFILDWDHLVPVLSLDMFEYALQYALQKPRICELGASSLEQMQAVVRHVLFNAASQHRLISGAIIYRDRLRLDWMLNVMQWSGCIDDYMLETEWDEELMNIFEQSVVSGRLKFKSLRFIPPQISKLQVASMTLQNRQEQFNTYKDDFTFAEVLWLPEFVITIVIDSEAEGSYRLEVVDGALRFIGVLSNLHAVSFRCALFAAIRVALDRLSPQRREMIFQTCCNCGLSKLAELMWTMYDLQLRFNHVPVTMFEFAFTRLQSTNALESCITSWFQCQLLNNNHIALFRFLIDNNRPTLNRVMNNPQFLKHVTTLEFAIVSLLWPTHKNLFLYQIDKLLSNAINRRDFLLVDFLCSNVDLQLPPHIANHIVILATKGCVATIVKIPKNTLIPMHKLCNAYTSAKDCNTVCALFDSQVNATINLNCFMQAIKRKISLQCDTDVEKCLLFVKFGFITTRKLYDVFVEVKERPNWKTLFTRLYFDIDF